MFRFGTKILTLSCGLLLGVFCISQASSSSWILASTVLRSASIITTKPIETYAAFDLYAFSSIG